MNHPRPFTTQAAVLTPAAHALPAPRSRAAAFFDWVLGTHAQQESTWAPPSEPDIVVGAPCERGSWVDSFHAALTEATTRFIVQHVDPYHREDPSAGFAVNGCGIAHIDGCQSAVLSSRG